jgi:hypothetical protein
MRCLCRTRERLSAQCVLSSWAWVAAEGKGQGQGWQRRSGRRAVRQGGGGGEQQRRGEHVAWGGQPPQHAAISKHWPPQCGGGCSAGRAPFRRGREWCAADAPPGCWWRQEGEGAPAKGAAEAAQDGGGAGGATGSDGGDVGREVREPSVWLSSLRTLGRCSCLLAARRAHSRVLRVWLQRGEHVGRGGGGDGGGGEARGSQ